MGNLQKYYDHLPITGFLDALQQGVYGDGTQDDATQLQTLVNTTTRGVILRPTSQSYKVGAGNVTVPINGTLWMLPGSSLSGAGSVSVAAGGVIFDMRNGTFKVTGVAPTFGSGLTVSGGVINLNASSNFATNINTGTSTGAVSIGNATAGALTVASGAASSIAITGAALTITAGLASTWTVTGGLTIANALTVSTGGIAVTGNSSINGNLLVNGAGATISGTTRFQVNGIGTDRFYLINQTDGALNQKIWDMFSNAGALQYRVISDDLLTGNVYMVVNRSGITLTGITFNTGLTVTLGTITASTPALTSTATWNAGAVAFTHYFANITNTASAAGSKLIDLQVGAVTQFNVTVGGAGTIANGLTISAAGLTVTGGISTPAATALNITATAASTWDIGANTLSIQTTANGAITTGTGLLTQGGNLTFSGVAARTITGPGAGGLTITDAGGNITISTTASGVIAISSVGALNLTSGSSANITINAGAGSQVSLTPTAATSGSIPTLTVTGAANTGQTAATEAIDVNWNLARTVTFATGVIATQRAFLIQGPTYAFSGGASTITTAITAQINGPLPALTATFTNSVALDIPTYATNGTTASGLRIAAPTGAATNNGILVTSGGINTTGPYTTAGGAASINASSNFNTVINTGTSTGTIGIGNSAAGALTIASGAGSSIAITGAALTITAGLASTWTITGGLTLANALTLTSGKLTTAASVAGAASLNVPAGTAPTTPVEGDVWNDSTRKAVIGFVDGINTKLSGVVFVATASVTVTAAAATSIIGTGIGTQTLPANFFTPGKTVRVTIRGIMSTAGAAPGTLDVQVKLGATVIADTTAVTATAGLTNTDMEIVAYITCRTTGVAGTIFTQGRYSTGGTAATNPNDLGMINTATTTIDTTVTQLLDCVWTWGAPVAGDTVTSTNVLIEVLN